MSAFEKYLSVWVALALALGILLGQLAPPLFEFLAAVEYAKVNLVVAILAVITVVAVAAHVGLCHGLAGENSLPERTKEQLC